MTSSFSCNKPASTCRQNMSVSARGTSIPQDSSASSSGRRRSLAMTSMALMFGGILLTRGRGPRLLRSSGLSVAPRFRWECLTIRTVSWFPAPATSHVASGFPALRAPAHFAQGLWDLSHRSECRDRLSIVPISDPAQNMMVVSDRAINFEDSIASPTVLRRSARL
jgi:hypothetical protein